MKCRICGTNSKPGTEFCPNCGYKLIRASETDSSGLGTDPGRYAPSESSPQFSPVNEAWSGNAADTSAPKKTASSGIFLTVFLVFLGVCVIAAVIYNIGRTTDNRGLEPFTALESTPAAALSPAPDFNGAIGFDEDENNGVYRDGIAVYIDDADMPAFKAGSQDTAIEWADPEFERMIRAALNRGFGDIYPQELEWITSLHIVGSEYVGINYSYEADGQYQEGEIRSLLDLQYFPEVTELFIEKQPLESLQGIEACTKVVWLSLDENNLGDSDLENISSFTGLTALWIAHNNLTDISALSDLKELSILNFSGNLISDISPVAYLASLTSLTAYSNYITDLTPLENLSLLVNVDLYDNNISDLSPLKGLKNITTLDIELNPVEDLSPVEHIETVYSDVLET